MDTSLPIETLMERLELLLDDELDDCGRGELLLYLDSVPDGWRICAAMFLEAQTIKKSVYNKFGEHSSAEFDKEFAGHENEVYNINGVSQLIPALEDGEFEPPVASAPKAVDRPESEAELHEMGHLHNISVSQAIAVSTLVGFLAIVFTIMSVRMFDSTPEPFMDRWIASLPENWDEVNPYEKADLMPAGLRMVESPKKIRVSLEPGHEIDLPLFNSDTVDPGIFHSYCSISPGLIDRLKRSGREISVRRCDEILSLDDGSKAIVPVETVYVRKREGNTHTRRAGAFTVYGPGVVFHEDDSTERIAEFMRQCPNGDCKEMQLNLAVDSDEKVKEYRISKGTAQWKANSLNDLPSEMSTQLKNAIRDCVAENE